MTQHSDIARGHLIAGLGTSIGAIVLVFALWGLVFDSTGGEPFSATIFGACSLLPALAIAALAGAFMYRVSPGFRRAMLGLDAALLVCVLVAWIVVVIRNS